VAVERDLSFFFMPARGVWASLLKNSASVFFMWWHFVWRQSLPMMITEVPARARNELKHAGACSSELHTCRPGETMPRIYIFSLHPGGGKTFRERIVLITKEAYKMNHLKTKTVFAACLIVASACFLAIAAHAAEIIRAQASPSTQAPLPGETFSVAVSLDLTERSELLGAFSGTLSWNPAVLRYVEQSGAELGEAARMVVNARKADAGRLQFAGFNPDGNAGMVDLLSARFEVIGAPGAAPGLQLQIEELYAARTYVDLMPYLETVTTGIDDEFGIQAVPEKYELLQNYPNPFNAGTDIRFALPKDGHIRLEVYNLLGAKVKTLVDAMRRIGRYKAHWDGRNANGMPAPSGVYLYRLQADGFVAQMRMIYLK